MKILAPAFAAVVALLAASGSAASPGPVASASGNFLRGAQCLDPTFARGWVYLDDRNILVDAGRYRYRIELSASCREIASTPVITFRGDPISGRVCGGPFDAVVTRAYPCGIQRMELLSKEQYKALESQRARERAERKMQRRIKS